MIVVGPSNKLLLFVYHYQAPCRNEVFHTLQEKLTQKGGMRQENLFVVEKQKIVASKIYHFETLRTGESKEGIRAARLSSAK